MKKGEDRKLEIKQTACYFSQDHPQTRSAALAFAELLCCNTHDLHYRAR